MSDADKLTLETPDGSRLHVARWLPAGPPVAVVQIAHGASEHSARYGRVAAALVDAGYAVYANDHRGHGRTAEMAGVYGVARPGGWDAIVEDARMLTERIRADWPDLPIVLLGHSMGSMIAQGYLQRWGDDLDGLVLSGTTGGLAGTDDAIAVLEAAAQGAGADQPSEVFAAMFAGFNQPFAAPDATGFEWLSRDADEVRKYVEDDWCGQPLSNGFVLDMLQGARAMWEPTSEAGIPRDVPMLVFSGDRDPVGGERGESVRGLVERYRALGVEDVTLVLYPEGRHEMFNETNRDEVTADLVAWLDAKVGPGTEPADRGGRHPERDQEQA
jgi:alpha-beta hydrolase superfamily lysophospholipase